MAQPIQIGYGPDHLDLSARGKNWGVLPPICANGLLAKSGRLMVGGRRWSGRGASLVDGKPDLG
jgi:hypothetical protein